jgi:tRNA threonylcarbamoyl adenosine modification protein YeaZ
MMSSGSLKTAPRDPRLIISGVDEHLQIVLSETTPEAARVVAAVRYLAPSRANPLLAPACKDMLEQHGLCFADLAGIAAVRGPGAFTGIRMALAFVQGLQAAARVPCAGLQQLRLLARAPLSLRPEAHVLVLTHSRTRQVYAQAFHNADVQPVTDIQALSLEASLEIFKALPKPAFILGGAVSRNSAFYQEHIGGENILPAAFHLVSPDELAMAAAAADYGMEAIEPLYIRASDAEENLPEIAAKRGMSPGEAEKIYKSAISRRIS